jgi:hypothetical protein
VTCSVRAFGVAIGMVMGLALDLSPRPSIAQQAAVSRPGPITLVYRDDISNVRQLKGFAHYGGVLGRDSSVSFTVANQGGEQVCNGTFTADSPRRGRFSLTCFNGSFSGDGTYERSAGDRRDSFIARGQTARGQRIMLVVGRPAGITEGQFLSP